MATPDEQARELCGMLTPATRTLLTEYVMWRHHGGTPPALLLTFLRRQREREEVWGRIAGKREVLLKLVARAGLALTADQRARIAASTDVATLDRWIDGALADQPPDTWLG